MRTILQLSERAVLGSLPRCRETVLEKARGEGVASGRLTDLDLIVEEVLVNVVTHAYPAGAGSFGVACRADDERFEVEVTDEGVAFNPLSMPTPDVTQEMSRRKIGGLGIYLVRQLADGVRYRREEGRNVLTVTLRKDARRDPRP